MLFRGWNEYDVNNVTICQNGELIDLLPQNESEVDSLYNIMTYNINQQVVIDRFQHSQFDRLWKIMHDYTPDDSRTYASLIFEHQENPRKFFHYLWQIGQTN